MALLAIVSCCLCGYLEPRAARSTTRHAPRKIIRTREVMARNPWTAYEAWDPADGHRRRKNCRIRRVRNIEFFTPFKQNHPDQLVMLHYNGNARGPAVSKS